MDDDFDCTQDLGLAYDIPEKVTVEVVEVGKLTTFPHRQLPQQTFLLHSGVNVVGRGESCDVLINVNGLSKKHACIEHSDDGLQIYDLDSRNKTLLDDVVLAPYMRHVLKDSSVVTFGDLKCRFFSTCQPDSDATRSLGGSDAGSESLIPEGEEEVLQVDDSFDHETASNDAILRDADLIEDEGGGEDLDESIIAPTQQNQGRNGNGMGMNGNDSGEIGNDSRLSDVILPTQQESRRGNSTQKKHKATKEAYADDTDTDTGDTDTGEENVGEENDDLRIIEQTPGMALGSRTKSCVSTSNTNGKVDVVEESPHQGSPCSAKELVPTGVFQTPLAKNPETRYESSDEEEMPGTYVFTAADFGEFKVCPESDADDEDEDDDEDEAGDESVLEVNGNGLEEDGVEDGDGEDEDHKVEEDRADEKEECAGVNDNSTMKERTKEDEDIGGVEEYFEGSEGALDNILLDSVVEMETGVTAPTGNTTTGGNGVGEEEATAVPVANNNNAVASSVSDHVTSSVDGNVEDESQVIAYSTTTGNTTGNHENTKAVQEDNVFVENSDTDEDGDDSTQPYSYGLVEMDVGINGGNGGQVDDGEGELDAETQMYITTNTPVSQEDLEAETQMYATGRAPASGNDFDGETQMYATTSAPIEGNDVGGETPMFTSTSSVDDATQQFVANILSKDDDEDEDDIDDIATQCYTKGAHAYDDVATQLYYIEPDDRGDKVTSPAKLLCDDEEGMDLTQPYECDIQGVDLDAETQMYVTTTTNTPVLDDDAETQMYANAHDLDEATQQYDADISIAEDDGIVDGDDFDDVATQCYTTNGVHAYDDVSTQPYNIDPEDGVKEGPKKRKRKVVHFQLSADGADSDKNEEPKSKRSRSPSPTILLEDNVQPHQNLLNSIAIESKSMVDDTVHIKETDVVQTDAEMTAAESMTTEVLINGSSGSPTNSHLKVEKALLPDNQVMKESVVVDPLQHEMVDRTEAETGMDQVKESDPRQYEMVDETDTETGMDQVKESEPADQMQPVIVEETDQGTSMVEDKEAVQETNAEPVAKKGRRGRSRKVEPTTTATTTTTTTDNNSPESPADVQPQKCTPKQYPKRARKGTTRGKAEVTPMEEKVDEDESPDAQEVELVATTRPRGGRGKKISAKKAISGVVVEKSSSIIMTGNTADDEKVKEVDEIREEKPEVGVVEFAAENMATEAASSKRDSNEPSSSKTGSNSRSKKATCKVQRNKDKFLTDEVIEDKVEEAEEDDTAADEQPIRKSSRSKKGTKDSVRNDVMEEVVPKDDEVEEVHTEHVAQQDFQEAASHQSTKRNARSKRATNPSRKAADEKAVVGDEVAEADVVEAEVKEANAGDVGTTEERDLEEANHRSSRRNGRSKKTANKSKNSPSEQTVLDDVPVTGAIEPEVEEDVVAAEVVPEEEQVPETIDGHPSKRNIVRSKRGAKSIGTVTQKAVVVEQPAVEEEVAAQETEEPSSRNRRGKSVASACASNKDLARSARTSNPTRAKSDGVGEGDTRDVVAGGRHLSQKPKVIFTGINDQALQKIVTDNGGQVVDDIAVATHLVTDKVRRTVKFLCALGRGIPIVHSEWLSSSKASNSFVAHHRHILNDEAAERQYKFQLARSLEKAAESPLFTGKSIYVTKNVKPERKLLKEMIESAGGTYVGRVPKAPSDDVIVVSCEEDESESSKLLDKGFCVCTKEVVLAGILRQNIDTKHYSILSSLDSSQLSLSSDSGLKDDPGERRRPIVTAKTKKKR